MKRYKSFMKKLCQVVAVGALAIGSVACSSTAGVEGRQSKYDKQLRVNNPWLRPYLEIAELNHIYVGDILKANVTIFSHYSKDLKLQYKFTWYDEHGMVMEDDAEAWKTLNLYGKETKDIVGVAPTTQAREFKVVVRERENN